MPKKLSIFHSLPTFDSLQKGQALIILLLVMVVALTIGLSVASRTITDVKISTQSELSQKAFSAAEAGIEHALRQDLQTFSGASNVPIGNATYSVDAFWETSSPSFTPDRPVEKDDVVQLTLIGTTATDLNIYWNEQGQPAASLEVTEIYSDSGSLKVAKKAFNSDCTLTNGFTCNSPGVFTLNGTNYINRATVNLFPVPSAIPQLLRLRPFYNGTSVAVEAAAPPGARLPGQKVRITSTGTSGSITRKVEVTRSVSAAPPIFDYVLYSGQDITK